jgi:RimJ/RimL family protein N-acetyltransferase
MQPILYSKRLTLRPYTLADADDVQRLAGDSRIADTTAAIPHPYPDGAAEAWIATHSANYEARKAVVFAIVLAVNNELIGSVSLIGISLIDARAELGYWISAEHWSKGYCTEAASRLIRFAGEELGLTRIAARCLERNPASARVMEKAGLRREGLLPKDRIKDGKYEDILLYGLNFPGR